MNRWFPNDFSTDPEEWRVKLLPRILRVSLVLGTVVYVPSMYASIRSEFYGLAAIDTLVLATVMGLLFSQAPFRARATIYCLSCLLLAIGLLVSVGPTGQVYLFACSILATLLLGPLAGLTASLLSSTTLLSVGLLGGVAPTMVNQARHDHLVGWVVITLNFALVNILLTLAIAAVITALNRSLHGEVAARVSLERERTLLRTLLDALPDVVFTKDLKGRFVNANAATLTLVGLAGEDELAGKTDHDVFPPEIARALQTDDEQVLAGKPLLNREEQRVGVGLDPVWYLTIKVPLFDTDSRIIGLIGISRDITARKLAEAERARLLAQLQLQIERMPLAYLLSDADFHYTRWNPMAERTFGFSESEVLGRHPFDVIVPPSSRAFVSTIFDDIRRGSMNAHGESENTTRSGKTIVCRWHNTPMFHANGEFAGLMSLAEDVTERKGLEDQYRQAQKMEAIGRLAGGVAHDFNNLLTVIFGYCESLLAMPTVDAAARESIREISQAGERAASLTRQLLGFSRQSMLQPQILDLNEVVTETGKMLRRLIGEDIVFATVLDPRLSRVKVDPGQLDQVLMNLAVNARDSMPNGGTLTVESSNVLLGDEFAALHQDCTPGPHVMLAMSDTGYGMTPEVMARVFEPFFTTKDVGRGTGLGLAMVFGIVKQSGGSIHVYSEPGRGTTFKIYLPAVVEDTAVTRASDSQAGLRGTESILLVEDEEGVRGLASRVLKMFGYQVLTATDGKDALDVLNSHRGPLDLILTDVVMPNMGGPELVQQLRPDYPRVKVLFMSGYTDDAVVRHGLIEADVAFIQKPYTPLSLARKVRQVFDEHSKDGGG